jgi:hypothetical protein
MEDTHFTLLAHYLSQVVLVIDIEDLLFLRCFFLRAAQERVEVNLPSSTLQEALIECEL